MIPMIHSIRSVDAQNIYNVGDEQPFYTAGRDHSLRICPCILNCGSSRHFRQNLMQFLGILKMYRRRWWWHAQNSWRASVSHTPSASLPPPVLGFRRAKMICELTLFISAQFFGSSGAVRSSLRREFTSVAIASQTAFLMFVTVLDSLHCKIDAFSEYFSTKQLSSWFKKLFLCSRLTASRTVAMPVTGMWEREFWEKHPD